MTDSDIHRDTADLLGGERVASARLIEGVHGYAARSSWRGSRRQASQLSGDTSPFVASASSACDASDGILSPRAQCRILQGLSEC